MDLYKVAETELGFALSSREKGMLRDTITKIEEQHKRGAARTNTQLEEAIKEKAPYLTHLVEQGIDQMTPTRLTQELASDLSPKSMGRLLMGYGIYSYKATIQGKQQRVYDLKQILEII